MIVFSAAILDTIASYKASLFLEHFLGLLIKKGLDPLRTVRRNNIVKLS